MFSALWNSNPLFLQLSNGFTSDWDLLIAESWHCRQTHKHACTQTQGPHFPRLNACKQWALSNCWAPDLSRFTVESLVNPTQLQHSQALKGRQVHIVHRLAGLCGMLALHRATLGLSVHRDKRSEAEGHKMLDLTTAKENNH